MPCYFSILWTLIVETALCETALWWLWLRLSAMNTKEVSKSAAIAGLYWRTYFLSARMWLLGLSGFFFQEFLFCSSFYLQCFSSRSLGCLTELHLHFQLPLLLQLFFGFFCKSFCSAQSIYPSWCLWCQLPEGSSLCCCTGLLLSWKVPHHTLLNCAKQESLWSGEWLHLCSILTLLWSS